MAVVDCYCVHMSICMCHPHDKASRCEGYPGKNVTKHVACKITTLLVMVG